MFAVSPSLRRFLASMMLVLALASPASAALPTEPAARARFVGQPAALRIEPERLQLQGSRAMQQVLIQARYGDGSTRDVTALSDYRIEGDAARITPSGFLTPVKDGTCSLVVQAGGQTLRIPVQVTDFEKAAPISFRHQLVAALNVGGCNQGACHGTPSGKGGFRLSLRGYDPVMDYQNLTREVLGRRTNRQNPDNSLILLKGLARVPHEGGQRFTADSIPAQTIRAWLAEGLRDDAADLPTIKRLEVLPGSRVLHEPARFQQLAVRAHFSNGTVRDVTRLTNFSSSDPAVADVSGTGLVEFGASGEVAILCRYLEEMQAVRLTYLEPKKDFVWSDPPANNYIDQLVFAKLKLLSIQPSELCSDAEFIRRVYLDVCGILPTPAEVRTFLADGAKDKRQRLVDQLLQRPEYADFWTLKWADVLRNSRKALQVKGTHTMQHWLRAHLENNTGLDRIVYELLTANGSTFDNPPASFYRIARDPTSLAETTAQLFFGIRMQCAKCHNHPFEKWTQDDYYSMAAFFARVKTKKDPSYQGSDPKVVASEFIYSERAGEVQQPRTGKAIPPKFMGGPVATVPDGKDRREVLATWLTGPENPFFPKSVVNRIWYHLFGRGIVDPVDDFRDSNPSANDELLDALAKDFVKHGFDLRHSIRTIALSRTYQLSARTNAFNKDDQKYFSHALPRLLSAETMLDAICTATEVPEKYPGLPLGTRAVQLPDGEINHAFLKTFGQPGRELACECERENDSNLAQALQLINGPTINEKVRSGTNRLGRMLTAKSDARAIVEELYLASLSRPPSEDEIKVALEHIKKGSDPRKAWEDVQWALLNAKEFLFRH